MDAFYQGPLCGICSQTQSAVGVQELFVFVGDPNGSFLRYAQKNAIHRVTIAVNGSVAQDIYNKYVTSNKLLPGT